MTEPKLIRADLHFHGPIGFQPKWLKLQGCYGKNLTKEITDLSLEKGVGLVNIISEDHKIPKDDVIFNKFNALLVYARELPSEYSHYRIGKTALIVEKKGEGRVIITNGQVPVIKDNGKRYDHIVVGSNQVPNHRTLAETIVFCRDMGLVQIAEHPFCIEHYGVGEDLFVEHKEDYDVVEGHNAQMVFPEFLSFLPVIGIANRGVNRKAKELAKKYNKPWVASSDAHNLDRASGFGKSYIEFDESLLDFSSDYQFIGSLKKMLRYGKFKTHEGYSSFVSWFRWCGHFVWYYKGLPRLEQTSVKRESADW